MIYTKAMNELLQKTGEDGIKLLSYYLDNYFDEYIEPRLRNRELKNIWFLLLVNGLIAEIRYETKYKKIAKERLEILINYNAVEFEKKSEGKKHTYLTVNYGDKKRNSYTNKARGGQCLN